MKKILVIIVFALTCSIAHAEFPKGYKVEGSENVGGFIGCVYGDSAGTTITNCFSTGSVSGTNSIGGFIGSMSSANGYSVSISNSYATGTVQGGDDSTGGFAGQVNCYSDGSISIWESYATGNVISEMGYTGGFIGYANATSTSGYLFIDKSFATGDVETGGSVGTGGFIGCIEVNEQGNYAVITNSFASGCLSATGSYGGFFGYANINGYSDEFINISNNYYNSMNGEDTSYWTGIQGQDRDQGWFTSNVEDATGITLPDLFLPTQYRSRCNP